MFNTIIKNGIIIDGTGSPKFRGDVGIKDGKILEIGDLSNELAEEVIDAKGQYVSPGFIDVNNHSDTYWRLFVDAELESLLYQGVTTIIGGNCGSSLAPISGKEIIQSIQKWVDIRTININWNRMEEFLGEVSRRKISVNFATLAGHGTLRRGVTRNESRALNSEEFLVLQKMLKDSLREGALGLSTGLVYVHARDASFEELCSLAEVVAKNDGVYTTHVRGESRNLIRSIEEAIEIAKVTGVTLHISHLKAMGQKNWSLMDEALRIIEKASSEGINVSFDVYPYTATGSVLYILLPEWVTEGGKKIMLKRLQDKEVRAQVAKEMKEEGFDYEKITIASSLFAKNLAKRNIKEIALSQGKSVEEAVIDTLIAGEGRIITSMEVLSEKNVTKGICHPLSIISSNGAGYSLGHRASGELVHPRSFGTFPKFLGKYVRELKILKWEEAIQKITSRPAKIFNIPKRGIIKKGNIADVVVFDPKKISGDANSENPYQYSEGVSWVLVNGTATVANGKHTGKRDGIVIKKSHLFF